MSLRSILTEEKPIAGVNIVPVIDLCLVLLIILMVTSPILDQAQLPVKLPQASTIETKEKNIAVTFSPDGRIAVNTQILDSLDQFASALKDELRADPDTLVIIRVDREANYAVLTDLWERCKKAGARKISIGTEQTKVQ